MTDEPPITVAAGISPGLELGRLPLTLDDRQNACPKS